MKKKLWRFLCPVLISCLVMLVQYVNAFNTNNSIPYAVKGKIDLDEWNKHQAFQIAGEWEFYWDRELTSNQLDSSGEPFIYADAPSIWNVYEIDGEPLPGKGVATYRLHVVNATIGEKYGIRVQNMATAYKLYIDSDLLAQTGNFNDNGLSNISSYTYNTVSYTPKSTEFDLIMQIANPIFPTGGMTEPILIGKYQQVNNMNSFLSNMNNISISILIFICILFLIVFAAQKREGDLFVLVCFGITVIIRLLLYPFSGLSFAALTPNMSIQTLVRLDNLTIIWASFLFVFFIYIAYGTYIKKWQIMLALAYSILASLYCLLPFNFILSFDSLAYTILYLMILFSAIHLGAAVWHNEDGAHFFFGVLTFYVLYIFYYTFIYDYSLSYYVFMSPALAILVLFIVQFINVAQRYSRAQKIEMSAYKNQIHPHFFNNSLAGIISVARTDPTKSRELLLDMSSYLRGFYDYLDDDIITLNQELDLVNAYATLNKMRFGDHVKVNYQLEVSNIMLPPLILEPLVENAFVHGLREKEDGGEILIYSRRLKNGKVRVGVKDNGVGLEKSKESPSTRQGVGIKNINMRLKKLYRTQLIYESPAEGGCNVYMEIPYKEAPTDENISG